MAELLVDAALDSQAAESSPAVAVVAGTVCEPPSLRPAKLRRRGIRRIRLADALDSPVLCGKRKRMDDAGSGSQTIPSKSAALDAGQFVTVLPYGAASVCGRRREMEDAFSIRPAFLDPLNAVAADGAHHFYGVFDGHGCSHIADACGERMHAIVAEEARSGASVPSDDEWTAVMGRSFKRMDEEAVNYWSSEERRDSDCRCERCDHVGSTAVVAVVGPKFIVVANCGDSRAVLSRAGTVLVLSTDHKPDRQDELDRIQEAGGRVIYWDGPRVLGVLAMSRAIGDGYLKPYVTAEPETTVTARTAADECLILASDGLWDVVTNEMACNVVRTCLNSNSDSAAQANEYPVGSPDSGSDKGCANAALLLTKLALARGSTDNISVVVVDLRCC